MITIRNLSFYYKKKEPLFEGLDLDLEQGHIYGCLGKNGAGKTTLMKIVSGLLYPNDGECTVMGYQPKRRQTAFLEDVFLITEDFYIPHLTISQYKDAYASFYPRFNNEEFKEYLSAFDVDKEEKLSSLSFGQRKKVFLSFGLATNCRLLLLDEPTNGLDIPSKAMFRKIIARSISEDQSYIISTHQVKDLDNLIDSVIVLEDSRVIFHQDTETITEKLYFGTYQGIDVPDDVLYSERIPGGFRIVKRNDEQEATQIEMESLFNTVLGQKTIIQEIFKNKAS